MFLAITQKLCLMVPKFDTLFKHDGKRMAKKDMHVHKVKTRKSYIATKCCWRKNLCLYIARPPITILEVVNNCLSVEATRKQVQFAIFFQILVGSRPMVAFESQLPLYDLLKVPNLPYSHWCDNCTWTIANYMYQEVTNAIKKLVQQACYIVVTMDEESIVNNGNWLSLHCYVLENWCIIPLLVYLKRVEIASNTNNLTTLIMEFV